ncbi:MAG: hypothetical protein DRQ88_04080 [Epsilonproteobacteria bacterium]|nr:MAG: hypothetical protein DRQ89_00645 [Campylobacterota bacterium]RLA67080.1 MAG: hypothetical protein DRQ88_04080 [Campylobacterota bacterium]
MKTFKTFLAGMAFPAIFLPFLYSYLFLQGNPATTQAPIALGVHFAPILVGLWSVLAIKLGNYIFFKDTRLMCTSSGLILGIIVGVIATFVYPLFETLFGLEGALRYFPLIFYPILFSLIFRFVVHPLNKSFGVY